MVVQAPEGTKDLLPKEANFWRHFRNLATCVFARYGYEEIETPLLEQTDLFVRGIGESSDVVSKEMFTALSGNNLKKLLAGEGIKAKSRLSLRPEGTAGIVRAVVQHNLVPQGATPAKLMYAGPMFRAERPQKGRQRQFNQIGIECLGASEPSVDAEGIIMLMRFFTTLGIPIQMMDLLLNSMGCDECRPPYRAAVKNFLNQQSEKICDDCKQRAETNPLRAFDCKKPGCIELMKQAPKIGDYLCQSCREHYNQVKAYVEMAGISYREESKLVRGFDYYTRTVFEVQVNEGMGSQNAIGGGGRYDKLIQEVGGRPTPGFGFALGYERCLLALQAAACVPSWEKTSDVFVASMDEQGRNQAFLFVQSCRDAGLSADMDHQRRSLKSQFKLADKLGCSVVVIMGPEERQAGLITLRDMHTHLERKVPLSLLQERLNEARSLFERTGKPATRRVFC